MTRKTLRIATRQSNLALVQTRWVAARLREHVPDLEVEEVHIVTKGDQVTDRPLYQIGGKGLFVSSVEGAVARGEADIAVHSLKDVPGDVELAEGLDLLCFPEREAPHDVLVTRDGTELMGLEAGGKIGTTSLRRTAQLKAQRPDLAFGTLRGNVETRLGKLDEGQFVAIVLAEAGMKRLGYLEGRHVQVLPPETCLPAVGQGTLGIEGRVDDEELKALLKKIECPRTRLITEAERAYLKRLQGSCRVPIAGHGQLFEDDGRLRMRGLVGSIDGERLLSSSSDLRLEGRDEAARIEEARKLGVEVADALIAQGARELMREAEATLARREKMN